MANRSEIENFIGQNCILEVLGQGRTLVFHGVIKSCGPSGVLLDNGQQSAILPYSDIVKIRQKGEDHG